MPQKTCVLFFMASAAILVLNGCQMAPYQGEAHDVKTRPREGGIVAIKRAYRPEDRTRAEERMASACAPRAYQIVEEGEVITGQEVVSNTRETRRDNSEQQVGSLFGVPLVTGDKGGHDAATSSTSRNTKEWQITYACDKEKKAASNKASIKSITVE